MRVNQPTLAAHRQALLDNAGKLFRARGIDAVSLAEISRDAGLTHGAFYGHFASKTALAAEAAQSTLLATAARWRRRAERARAAGLDPLAALIDGYLTTAHRDTPADGCPLAALGPEIARAAPPLGTALLDGTAALAAVLAEEIRRLAPDASDPAATALAMLATLIGGIVLARALAADPARSQAALAAAAKLARSAVPTHAA